MRNLKKIEIRYLLWRAIAFINGIRFDNFAPSDSNEMRGDSAGEKRDENIKDAKGRRGFSIRDPPINCVTHNLLPGRAHELVPSRVCTVGMVGITRRARAHKQATRREVPGRGGARVPPIQVETSGPGSNSRPAFAYNRRCIRSRARSGRVHIHPPPPPPPPFPLNGRQRAHG